MRTDSLIEEACAKSAALFAASYAADKAVVLRLIQSKPYLWPIRHKIKFNLQPLPYITNVTFQRNPKSNFVDETHRETEGRAVR
jgi:hypothetical protein